MEIQFYGANCVRLSNKKASLVVDDNLTDLGLKPVIQADDIALFTWHEPAEGRGRFLINGPGEYEISEISIRGIPVRSHIDSEGTNSTIYNLQVQDLTIGILGHIYPDLSDEQLEAFGLVDLLIIPVGGNGYTIDAAGAAQLIKKLEPKIVIPTHYADNALKYEVPQAELQVFLSEMGISEPEQMNSFKMKESELGDKTRVIVLDRLQGK